MSEEFKQKIIIAVISIAIGISCIFLGVYVYHSVHADNQELIATETQKPLSVDDGVDINKPQEEDEDFTEIPVYTAFTVSKKKPNIYLGNPEINNVYFKYKVYLKPDDGEEIEPNMILFDSESVIKPGRAFEINIYDLLKPGKYQVILDISTFSLEDETQCNGASQEVTINVTE